MTAAPAGETAALGLRDLDLALGYDTADQALRDFYVPALSRATRYDRSVGYFRASAFSVAARGLSRFIAGGGTARFLVGAEIGEHERLALVGAERVPDDLAERLAQELVPADEIDRRRLEVIAWLVQTGRLEIRVAIATDEDGTPVVAGEEVPYFHEKIGVLRDDRGDAVAFQGSVNESAKAWSSNFESFSVYTTWGPGAPYFDTWADKFEGRWAGQVPGFMVLPLPEAVAERLVSLAPSSHPPPKDPEEPEAWSDRRTVGRFLLAAPRLVGSEALAEATSAVVPFVHQRKVVERLAGEYPRSWLVADEVGLGKTISAGLALRRLLLSGEVQRAVVMAPANVCIQWQDELFERFGLWVPRLDAGKIHGAHPDDVQPVQPGSNPYEDEHPVLLVSSHLARRPSHQRLILAAPVFDLVIVDEAHHARRRGADLDEYRPSRLLQLLDAIRDNDRARAVWLLTATPMQVHPIELHDLLRHVGLSGPCENFGLFERFYAELAKSDDAATDWAFLHRCLAEGSLLPMDAADRAQLDNAGVKLGPVAQDRIARFGRHGEDPVQLADDLGPQGRRELRAWLRQRGPVGQLVTRHSRATLRHYRDLGLLTEPIATRKVEAVPVPFGEDEARLYGELDQLLDRLMQAHGTKRGAGFVLTVYRRRLTSSWEAIRRTLRRRLEQDQLLLEPDLLDEADELDELDTGEGNSVDDAAAVPLSTSDLSLIRSYVADLERVSDSKFDQLYSDIQRARGEGRAVIVFTQFTDTLDYLRNRLHPAYRSNLATFSGNGAERFTEDGEWEGLSKQELVDAIRSGRISVLLATDAASEGLNLQSASSLINYDLPWNPMRVEQRIGRIDRIGQVHPIVTIRNYVVPGTVEESVYRALSDRIDDFSALLGRLQPILGATEGAFRQIFRAPRSERAQVQSAEIRSLMERIDELDESGLDLGDEDSMPEVVSPPTPVDLAQLRRCFTEELDITLDRPERPSTTDAERVSRDRERWTALATFGHPMLEVVLHQCVGAAGLPGLGDSALVIEESNGVAAAYRADRTPPAPVRTLADLIDLGPAVSLGEALVLAAQDAEAASAARMHRIDEIGSAQREKWLRGIQHRFRRLVTRTIRAEQALRRLEDGEAPDPLAVWLNLLGDEGSAWVRADQFRQHLELPLSECLPRGGPGADERGESELGQVRSEAGQELAHLMQEWVSVQHPDFAG